MSWMMAKLYDRFLRVAEEACLQAWRADLLQHATGRVLELGAGTGANVPFYGPTVTHVTFTEPDPHMAAELKKRLAAAEPSFEWTVSDASAERLPFEDGSFDCAVSTLVLCTVERPDAALDEIRRVLAADGTLFFLEHVAAKDNPDRLKWQHRCEPVWKHVAGGCHLTRDTEAAIRDAGFVVTDLVAESMRKALPIVRPTIRGCARHT